MKIIVSSCLGVVGRGILNSIRKSAKYSKSYIIGLDILETKFGINSGLLNEIIRSPRYSDPNYQEFILDIIEKINPDAVIISNELEILKLADLEIKNAIIPNKEFAACAISKKRLFENFVNSSYIPKFIHINREDLKQIDIDTFCNGKVWVRDVSDGTAGGVGSFFSDRKSEIENWIENKNNLTSFELSEFLPGKNLACTILMMNGNMVSAVCGERQNYLLSHLTKSGVTGYTNHGLIYLDEKLINYCTTAIKILPGVSNLSGIITVDLKEDINSIPKITEINLRYIGFVYAYALSGFNIVENHLNLLLGEPTIKFLPGSVYEFFRGIDSPIEIFKLNK